MKSILSPSKKRLALDLLLCLLLISSATLFLYIRSEKESLFDVMTAVSPLWAVFIALYLPARQDISLRIKAKADQKEKEAQVIMSLFCEVEVLKEVAETKWKKILPDPQGEFNPAQLFAPSRPISQTLFSKIPTIEPNIMRAIAIYELTIEEKMNAISYLKSMKSAPISIIHGLAKDVIRNCDSYMKELTRLAEQSSKRV